MGKRNGVLLTKRVVDAAAPGPTRFDIWDSSLAGFGLRVEKSRTKTFIVRYRADGGGRTAPRRFATIGRFGALTVDEAGGKLGCFSAPPRQERTRRASDRRAGGK